MRKLQLLLALLICFAFNLRAQDLDSLLRTLTGEEVHQLTSGTFKGTLLINGPSVELPGKTDLNLIISHRFGAINLGFYNFFGMDQASTRIGLEYGLLNNLSISLGRNTWEKTYDGAVKACFLRQQSGKRNIPVTASIQSAAYLETLNWQYPERDNLLVSRFSYATHLIIARKFNDKLSLQVSPVYIHKNLVPTREDPNNIFANGFGGRYKISRKISLNAEYYLLFTSETAEDYSNAMAVGVDIETGGHVFQLHCTNSQTMFSRGFITETTGNWLDGEIFFGFNICRVFSTGQNRKNVY